jgi:hypothetical protein
MASIDKTGGLPHNRRVRAVQDLKNKQVKRPARKMTNPPRSGK